MTESVPVLPEERPRPAVLLLAALATVLVAYVPALDGGFVWDDHALIEHQPLVQELHAPTEYFTRMFWADPLSNEKRDFYRPVVTLSYAIDWKLGGGRPFAFHLTNLLLHLACAALFFRLLRRLGTSAMAAALGTALWGTFPRLTESVAWVSGRTDVLATLGVLAALNLWPEGEGAGRRRVLAACALLVGLFSKEVAAAGVVGIAAWELLAARRDGRPFGSAVRRLSPVAVAVAVYAAFRLLTPRSDVQFTELGWRRVVAVGDAIARYAGMIVDGLRPELQIGYLADPSSTYAVFGVAIALASVALAIRALRRGLDPLIGALVATSAVALGLVLHVVPLAVTVLAADRFLYVPLLAVAALVALLLDRANVRIVGRLLAVVLVAAYAWATSQRSREWTNELKLFRDASRSAGEFTSLPDGVLGDVLSERGLYVDALRHYERANEKILRGAAAHGWKTIGDLRTTKLNIGVTLQMLGRYEDGMAVFDELLGRYPDWKKLRYGRALCELRRFRPDAAERELLQASSLLGEDEVWKQLLALVGNTRRTIAELPAEQDVEAPEITVRRAELFDELGAVFDAQRSWRKVLDSKDASAAQRRRAAGYIAVRGSPREGRRALEQLARHVPPDAETEALLDDVAEREREIEAAK